MKQNNPSNPVAMTTHPSVYIIRASDALQPAARFQKIFQKLKAESRIADFTILAADDDLSPIRDNVAEEDLILLVLTNQFEVQKQRIENVIGAHKTGRIESRIAEVIVDNIPYDNAFITFPVDLRPIRHRLDNEAMWNGMVQGLKDLFPTQNDRNPTPATKSTNERLIAVERHPDYPALLKIKPSSALLYGRYGCAVLFGLIFIAFSLISSFIITKAAKGFGSSGYIGTIALIFFSVVGIGLAGYGLYRLIKLKSARLDRLPALVVDKRTSVSGGGENSTVSTYYYITLAVGEGKRRELQAKGKLYGKITKDDAGVAYIRDNFLLDYKRLTV